MKKKQRKVAYVSVELPDEAGEVVVLEVLGKKVPAELRRVPHHEAVVRGAPRHYLVRRRVIHHVVRLAQKRRRRVPALHRHRRRRLLLLRGSYSAAARAGGVGITIHSVHSLEIYRNIEKIGLRNLD